jgi:hypothetical protein
MDEYESLNHTKYECKYHVVFIPKSGGSWDRCSGRLRSVENAK